MGCTVTGELLGEVVTGVDVGEEATGERVTGLEVTGLTDVGVDDGAFVPLICNKIFKS